MTTERRGGWPGPRRPLVAVRLNPAGIAAIDAMAEKAGVNRSEMIRILLGEAVEARRAKRGA